MQDVLADVVAAAAGGGLYLPVEIRELRVGITGLSGLTRESSVSRAVACRV